MNERLKALLEQRDQAQAEFDAFADPIIAANRDLTPEEETTRAEKRGAIKRFDARILELQDDAASAETLTEARKRAGIVTVDVSVTKEKRTYEVGSPNSFINDLVRASYPAFPGHREANARLAQWDYETSVEMARGTQEGQRARMQIAEQRRTENGQDARDAIRVMEERGNAGSLNGPEMRTGMDTTAGSGGSFATPQYFVSDYAPYREAGRAFVDQCNKQPLPEYGMAVYLPHVTGPAGVAAQGGDNRGVQETDPTAGYLSNTLTTLAGQVIISQQLLDRVGPNFSFDKLVLDQLERDYNPKVDQYVLAQALANAGAITYTDGSGFTVTARSNPGVGGFTSKVAGAKAAIEVTQGVVMSPTHLFVQPNRWDYIEAWSDSSGRPIVVPNVAGAFNAWVAGNSGDKPVPFEGDTGYKLAGLPVFKDHNIPTPGTGADQAIVGALAEVYVWEGTPVPRVIPQTYASNLSVLLDLYSYVTCIPRYPLAVQTVSGSGMAAITF